MTSVNLVWVTCVLQAGEMLVPNQVAYHRTIRIQPYNAAPASAPEHGEE